MIPSRQKRESERMTRKEDRGGNEGCCDVKMIWRDTGPIPQMLKKRRAHLTGDCNDIQTKKLQPKGQPSIS